MAKIPHDGKYLKIARGYLYEDAVDPAVRFCYSILLTHRNERTGRAFPTLGRLQAILGRSKPIVIGYLQQLQELKWIKKVGYTDRTRAAIYEFPEVYEITCYEGNAHITDNG